MARQCQLLKLARSKACYQTKPVSDTVLAFMRRIDKLHLHYTFAGARMLHDVLRPEGYGVGRRQEAVTWYGKSEISTPIKSRLQIHQPEIHRASQ
ncbi:MAG: hypothetical protein OJF50_006386 [Nitrospira sp.]|jgi:hypothetical protein|nr:hypothetical protein [Nitrospira sp.]